MTHRPGRRPAPGPRRLGPHDAELGGRPFVHLLPGDVYFSATPTAISTLLGSCVAVCLWDDTARVGGITHYLLPDPPPDREPSTRYGTFAVSVLVENLAGLGAALPRLRAKLFGGASVLSSLRAGAHVGGKNVALGRRMLASLDIPIVAEDTGGSGGRVVVFCSDSGRAFVREV